MNISATMKELSSSPTIPDTNTSTVRTSNIYTGSEARNKLMRGVDKVANGVKLTLGAAGANAVLESDLSPGHYITNDGVSIARMVELTDPVERIGANLIKEVANRSDKEGGDGTTTTTVLTQAILHAGIGVAAHPMAIKRSLDECLPIIEKAIDDQKRSITENEVAQVAAISSEDPKLGALFQEIYQQIGKDGIIELENSGLPTTYYTVGEGVRFRNTVLFGPHPQSEPGKVIYKNPLVMVSRQRISNIEELGPIAKAVQQTGRTEMVLLFDDIDMTAATQLAYAVVNGGFKVYLVKAPTLWKDWTIADFALVTGATVFDPATGVSLKDATVAHLGTCERLIGTKDEIRVIGIKDISEHIARLEAGSDDDKLRASWLNTKAATLYLGANSESELSYVRLKAEDARNASYLALQDGIVPGGGVALINIIASLPDTIGGAMLGFALIRPFEQILENAGIQDVADVRATTNMGVDVKTGQVVDMFEAGIVDPARVVKNAVRNAISVAGTVLTASVVVTLPSKTSHNENTPAMPLVR